jgi:hypothetical protein
MSNSKIKYEKVDSYSELLKILNSIK